MSYTPKIDRIEDDGTRTPMQLVEVGRWQDRIEELLARLHGGPIDDGRGCESGDPLDVSLAQIAWTFARLKDRTTDAAQRRDCDGDGEV